MYLLVSFIFWVAVLERGSSIGLDGALTETERHDEVILGKRFVGTVVRKNSICHRRCRRI